MEFNDRIGGCKRSFFHRRTARIRSYLASLVLIVVLVAACTGPAKRDMAGETDLDAVWMRAKEVYSTGQQTKALDGFDELSRRYHALGDRENESKALTWLARVYIDLEEIEKATTCLQAAQQLNNQLGRAPSEGAAFSDIDKISEASKLFLAAINYRKKGELQLAIESCLEAYAVLRDTTEKAYTARLLIWIGYTSFRVGDNYASIKYYRGALALQRELGNSSAIMETLGDLSDYPYDALGDYPARLECLCEALAICRGTSNLSRQGWIQKAMGSIYATLGDYAQADSCFREALKSLQEVGDKSGIGWALLSMAGRYAEQKDYERARALSTLAWKIHSELDDFSAEGQALLDIGYYFLQERKVDEALAAFTLAGKAAEKTHDVELMLYTIVNLGMAKSMKGDLEQAITCYQKAVEIVTRIRGVPTAQETWIGYYWFGKAEEGLNRLEDAKQHYARSIEALESMRGRLRTEKSKVAFLTNKLEVYERMILLLLRMGRDEEAFDYLERAKSRSLLDLLADKVSFKEGKDRALAEKSQALTNRLDNLSQEVAIDGRGGHTQEEMQSSVRGAVLESSTQERNTLLNRIAGESPELGSLLSVNPLSLRQFQKLLDDGTTVLEYYTTPEETILWLIRRSSLRVSRIPVSQDDLREKVALYRKKIETQFPDYRIIAEELYGLLIKPAAQYIQTRRLCIVPHGVLHYLPFHALLAPATTKTNRGTFLVESYDIFYLPSASVLEFVLEKRKPAASSLLALGNPDLGDPKYDLPFAEKEISAIGNDFSTATLFSRQQASEGKTKELADKHDILHLACHAEMRPEAPMLSCLRLSSDSEEDGRLEAREVFSLDLGKCSLVTLSACQTALGQLTSGDEMIGLSRGFIYAGAPSIVASLWSVSDESTARLMSTFYRNLGKESKASSLSRAERSSLLKKTAGDAGGPHSNTERTVVAHPFFWAPFILIGDWK